MQKQMLCCTCKTPSPTCTWKYNLTPVEGWETDEEGYVKTCPLYEENTREKKVVEEPAPGVNKILNKRRLYWYNRHQEKRLGGK